MAEFLIKTNTLKGMDLFSLYENTGTPTNTDPDSGWVLDQGGTSLNYNVTLPDSNTVTITVSEP